MPGKTARARRRNRISQQPLGDPAQSPYLILSGYEGANGSPMRGMVYWPTLDTRLELTSYADQEILRKVRWLYGNCGIARRVVNGAANLLGYLTPQPSTDDDDWNQLAYDTYMARQGSAAIHDAAGAYDTSTAQVAANVARFRDGRVLGVLTTGPGGSASMAYFEAQQIASGGAYSHYQQGVLMDRQRRPIRYSLRSADRPDQYHSVDAASTIYYGRRENYGRIHGTSLLAHAVPHLLDVVELRGLRKHAAKVHAGLGLVVEQDSGPMIQLPGGELLGVPIQRHVTSTTETRDPATGATTPTQTSSPVTYDQIVSGGGIPPLRAGQRIRVIADDRPTPNNLEFERLLIEDAIAGADLPPSVLYHLADLKGPGVRYNMEEVRRWVLLQHRRQAGECLRYYAYAMAREIASGRLPRPMSGGRELPWWREVTWIGLPSMTIDSAREGMLSVIRLESGLSTWADEWSAQGAFGWRKIRDRIWEVAQAKREIAMASQEYGVDLSFAEVFPRLARRDLEQVNTKPEDEHQTKPA